MTCLARRVAHIAAIALAVVIPAAAHAQFGSPIVFDPSNFVRNVLHYARRLEQMNMQRQQLQVELAALQKLKSPKWREISTTLTQIDGLLQDGQSLAYNLRAIDAEFRRTFPGAQAFRDYPAEQRRQAVRTLATLRTALDAANRATRDLPGAVAKLGVMKGQLTAARGHEEALEVNGTIAMYGVEELTMLRQAIAALTNVQAVVAADQVNATTQERETYRARLVAMSAPGPRYASISLQITP
ncbi:MAG: hypothetical protein HOQ09_03615 [Gemmatimonadaceae bacterium]|nr:hypothetical protein [Gemmatimonadaceae bacterium]